MAIPVEEQSVSSFPNPPSLFYKLYTDENVQSGLAPQPPLPVKGSYHAFGNPFHVCVNYLIVRVCRITH